MEKECIKCGDIKSEGLFPKSENSCKRCVNERKRAWKLKNPKSVVKIKEYNKDYYNKTRDKRKVDYKENADVIRAARRKYRKDNKTKVSRIRNQYIKNKRDASPAFKLQTVIRVSICRSIRDAGYTKKSRTHEILGCSFNEFKVHLEAQFEPWMNWDNHGLYNGEYGYGWDIDHIIPSCSAITEEDVMRLNHYTNLQPLCSKINRCDKRDL